MGDTGVILAAAGQGRRMRSQFNKVYLELAGKPVIQYSLDIFDTMADIAEIVVVTHPDEKDYFIDHFVAGRQHSKQIKVVPGGAERQDSIIEGLKALDEGLYLVAVHDAARPLLSLEMAQRAIDSARKSGAACPGVAAKDTLREIGHQGQYGPTLDRSRIYQIQTPQVFRLDHLKQAYQKATADAFASTDDASLYARYCGPVSIVEGEYRNIKITTAEDLDIARGLLGGEAMRVGSGYDVHRFAEGRDLIIGGVKIPWENGLLGHSDADVLVHALCDALLGAAALGDIGRHFPDNDDKYKNIDSLILLREVAAMLAAQGFKVENADCTIIAERPKMAPYINEMRKHLSEAVQVPPSQVNIKATTTEGLGFTGRGEGIAAQAIVLVRKS
ncbi:MAG: 2-C-methyl-D-erythritol 2,4-cyclodiphosphate synthase [Candidatus Saccharibacteria bacterium]